MLAASTVRKLPLMTADLGRLFKMFSDLYLPSVNELNSPKQGEAPVEIIGRCMQASKLAWRIQRAQSSSTSGVVRS